MSFNTEIPEIYASPRRIYTGTILQWNEFALYKGVQPVYPSKASKNGCAVGTNCVKNGNFPLPNSWWYMVILVTESVKLGIQSWLYDLPSIG